MTTDNHSQSDVNHAIVITDLQSNHNLVKVVNLNVKFTRVKWKNDPVCHILKSLYTASKHFCNLQRQLLACENTN